MPIKIIDDLPAKTQLAREHIFTIEQLRAQTQDIRPLKLLILNLMPLKEQTEVQLLRLLGNSPLQVDIDFCRIGSHSSKNTAASHLSKFYSPFEDITDQRYDGMIITGAPVETLPFAEVTYWDELTEIFEWSKSSVYSTLHICWGAQAGLYYHYGIDKVLLPQKLFGVYKEEIFDPLNDLMRGFDDVYHTCQSRHTHIDEEQLKKNSDLSIISGSPDIGTNIIANSILRQIFVLGHFEYDRMTLGHEYFRDLGKGLEIQVPVNYFPGDDVNLKPLNNWKSHANLFFTNWLNNVYHWTPYNLDNLPSQITIRN